MCREHLTYPQVSGTLAFSIATGFSIASGPLLVLLVQTEGGLIETSASLKRFICSAFLRLSQHKQEIVWTYSFTKKQQRFAHMSGLKC